MKTTIAVLIAAAVLLSVTPTDASAHPDDYWYGIPYPSAYLGNGHWGGFGFGGGYYYDSTYLGNGHWGGYGFNGRHRGIPYPNAYVGNGHWGGLIHPRGRSR